MIDRRSHGILTNKADRCTGEHRRQVDVGSLRTELSKAYTQRHISTPTAICSSHASQCVAPSSAMVFRTSRAVRHEAEVIGSGFA
ncbi:hypothetical protein K469DRAFT_715640 [Zopfia rhizophila CBS 207.26]|uniref:Uncharacterized protein n=1 Tax=Zopfia rhizophila CBS 207.26 TaxID=1314779 RepID=A0A6A6DM09_9PEZI|nr:hypothetical protein K469DRAFT_715640 [Zopfia rhizophila CBS 207.26]